MGQIPLLSHPKYIPQHEEKARYEQTEFVLLNKLLKTDPESAKTMCEILVP